MSKVCVDVSVFRNLLERSETLSALEAAGVDNWGGYSEADYSGVDILKNIDDEYIIKGWSS